MTSEAHVVSIEDGGLKTFTFTAGFGACVLDCDAANPTPTPAATMSAAAATVVRRLTFAPAPAPAPVLGLLGTPSPPSMHSLWLELPRSKAAMVSTLRSCGVDRASRRRSQATSRD